MMRYASFVVMLVVVGSQLVIAVPEVSAPRLMGAPPLLEDDDFVVKDDDDDDAILQV